MWQLGSSRLVVVCAVGFSFLVPKELMCRPVKALKMAAANCGGMAWGGRDPKSESEGTVGRAVGGAASLHTVRSKIA